MHQKIGNIYAHCTTHVALTCKVSDSNFCLFERNKKEKVIQTDLSTNKHRRTYMQT